MKTKPWIAVLVALLIGALVWFLSPLVSGQREAWDAQGYYFAALFAGGLVSGLIAPKPLWAHYIGAYVGQLLYGALFLTAGSLWIAGAILLIGYCLVFLFAAWVGGLIRTRL